MRIALLAALLIACDSPGSSTTSDTIGGDAAGDTASVIGSDSGDAIDGNIDSDIAADGDAHIGTDAPGTPDAPEVGCRSDGDCAGGEVCCTSPGAYLSACAAAADCPAGLHDACLTDDQCAARRPGEWTVCCHDLRDRNYCAPIADTCQPLVPCATPSDCAGQGSDVCCTRHTYYDGSFCTGTFFAADPTTDCAEPP